MCSADKLKFSLLSSLLRRYIFGLQCKYMHCTDVLVGMLSVNSCTLNSDLSAKAEKEMKKIKLKSKSILEKVVSKLPVNVQSHDIAPESQDPGQEDGGNKERKNLTAEGQSSEELPFRVDTDDISVSGL